MRELLFRAWDQTNGGGMEYCGLERAGAYHEIMGHHIMQYTGLKDKNGKEIYEGDILTWQDMVDPQVFKEVRYICNGRSHNGFNVCKGDNFKVIGNIYENPGLLKQGPNI